jgi:tetratricopeptide (TPR) repeat protein
MVYRVFLSSTSQDLVAEREAVLAAIAGLDGFAPIAMENFGARAKAAVDFDDRKIRQSQVVVGLLGLCYGSSPRGGPPSFTEREYDSALAAGIDRLMLVSPVDFPVPGDLIEPATKRRRQKAFRARVKADLIVDASDAAFASPAALATAVIRALANWRADREQAEEIVAELLATKTRAAELERALAEGQKEREALRAAVMALTGKAHQPEPPAGVERALDLLREGQTGEAQVIFAEVVERKEEEGTRKQAEGAADLREAAEAARHLGALAYLHSTQKALQAYTTATRLDPDHIWSWILLGRLHLRAGSLAGAEAAFEQARAAAERAGSERDVGVTYHELGMVRQASGDLAGALAAYQRYHEVSDQLAAGDPDNTGWQRDLSVSFNKIGDVQRARGNLDAALEAYQDSLAIAEKLAARDPSNARWQRDVWVSCGALRKWWAAACPGRRSWQEWKP